MKIVLATGLYPPEIGGPATYAAMLEAELPPRGITIHVVPFGWVRHYPKVIRHFIYTYKLWQESKEADIIYALDPISVGLPALLVARLRRRPMLIRLGGDYAWEQGRARFGLTTTLDEYLESGSCRPLPVRFLAALQTFVVRRAQRVIAPSEYLKRVITTWGVLAERIIVIYSALYPLSVADTKESLRGQFGYTAPTIVSAGRLVPWKGFATLIRTMASLKNQYPTCSLVIAGDGVDRALLERTASECGVVDRVRFTGDISKETLGATIKAADVFVLNTAYEGLSHQLLEVMELGTPIVTTPAGGNIELITDGESGLFVSFNDEVALERAITRVLTEPALATRLAATARERVASFRKEIVIEELITLLKQYHD